MNRGKHSQLSRRQRNSLTFQSSIFNDDQLQLALPVDGNSAIRGRHANLRNSGDTGAASLTVSPTWKSNICFSDEPSAVSQLSTETSEDCEDMSNSANVVSRSRTDNFKVFFGAADDQNTANKELFKSGKKLINCNACISHLVSDQALLPSKEDSSINKTVRKVFPYDQQNSNQISRLLSNSPCEPFEVETIKPSRRHVRALMPKPDPKTFSGKRFVHSPLGNMEIGQEMRHSIQPSSVALQN